MLAALASLFFPVCASCLAFKRTVYFQQASQQIITRLKQTDSYQKPVPALSDLKKGVLAGAVC